MLVNIEGAVLLMWISTNRTHETELSASGCITEKKSGSEQLNTKEMRKVMLWLMVCVLPFSDALGQKNERITESINEAREDVNDLDKEPQLNNPVQTKAARIYPDARTHNNVVGSVTQKDVDGNTDNFSITVNFTPLYADSSGRTSLLFNSQGEVIGSYRRHEGFAKDVESFKGEVTINGNSFTVTSLRNARISEDNEHLIISGDLPSNLKVGHRGGALYTEIYTLNGTLVSGLNMICAIGCNSYFNQGRFIYYAGLLEFGSGNQQHVVKSDMNGKMIWRLPVPVTMTTIGISCSPNDRYVMFGGSRGIAGIDTSYKFIYDSEKNELKPVVEVGAGIGGVTRFIDENVVLKSGGRQWRIMKVDENFRVTKMGNYSMILADVAAKTGYISSKGLLITAMTQEERDGYGNLIVRLLDVQDGKEQYHEVRGIQIPSGYKRFTQYSDSVFRLYSDEGILEITVEHE